jgi:hypothetical protein
MPKRRVTVSYGRTIQSAPYESIRLDVAIEKDTNDDANLKEEIDKSVDGLVMYVKSKMANILKNE